MKKNSLFESELLLVNIYVFQTLGQPSKIFLKRSINDMRKEDRKWLLYKIFKSEKTEIRKKKNTNKMRPVKNTEETFQWIMLEKADIHMQKNEVAPLPYTIYKK